ncbi:type VI secretion system baseplate subunit TssE [Pelomonas sp. KK5]|uniref:type VI secretion system baseplate subunit TssE n=1 Tax=Pelomonas sp. KK5 TaxID=1855730 RepID=UPI00097C786B|nr:GPW/gp25 family protein [Pelomonas sp. KK5]
MSAAPGRHPLHPAARGSAPADASPAGSRSSEQRFLPTLFDRLCDDTPSADSEMPGAYVPDRRRMREILQRDLAALLNTINHAADLDAARHPEVARSCVNYGAPSLAGKPLSERQWADIEHSVRSAIVAFEPRIDPLTLVVRPLQRPRGGSASFNVLDFEIAGLVLLQPYPLEFIVQSSADLETNRFELRADARRND